MWSLTEKLEKTLHSVEIQKTLLVNEVPIFYLILTLEYLARILQTPKISKLSFGTFRTYELDCNENLFG